MAGFITFSDEMIWKKSNWAYWGLMDHLIQRFESDESTKARLLQSKWMQNLHVPDLVNDHPNVSSEIIDALFSVAHDAAEGTLLCSVEGRVLDSDSQKMFSEAAQELLGYIRTYTGHDGDLSDQHPES